MLMPGLFIVSSRPDTSHTSSVRSRRVETSARFVADLLFLFYFVSQRRRGCRRLLCRCLWRLMNHLFPSLFLRCSSRRKEVENRSFGCSRRDLLSFQTTFRLPPSDHAHPLPFEHHGETDYSFSPTSTQPGFFCSSQIFLVQTSTPSRPRSLRSSRSSPPPSFLLALPTLLPLQVPPRRIQAPPAPRR